MSYGVSETEYMVFTSMAANQRDMVARHEAEMEELYAVGEALAEALEAERAQVAKLRKELKEQAARAGFGDAVMKAHIDMIEARNKELETQVKGLLERLGESQKKNAALQKEKSAMTVYAAVNVARAEAFSNQVDILTKEHPHSTLLQASGVTVNGVPRTHLQSAYDRTYAQFIRTTFSLTDADITSLKAHMNIGDKLLADMIPVTVDDEPASPGLSP